MLEYGDVIDVREDSRAPGYGGTVSGFGGKLPTRYWVRLSDSPKVWRRVYAMCYGNAASLYVRVLDRDVFLNDTHMQAILEGQES